MDCLIIDDNKISRLTLIQLIALDPSLNLIAECADAKDALNKILTTSVCYCWILKCQGWMALNWRKV